jgi:hypothetical protein
MSIYWGTFQNYSFLPNLSYYPIPKYFNNQHLYTLPDMILTFVLPGFLSTILQLPPDTTSTAVTSVTAVTTSPTITSAVRLYPIGLFILSCSPYFLFPNFTSKPLTTLASSQPTQSHPLPPLPQPPALALYSAPSSPAPSPTSPPPSPPEPTTTTNAAPP